MSPEEDALMRRIDPGRFYRKPGGSSITKKMLNEIVITPTGHFRCQVCDKIFFKVTRDEYIFRLVISEESISEIDKDRLPENFDLDALPVIFSCQHSRRRVINRENKTNTSVVNAKKTTKKTSIRMDYHFGKMRPITQWERLQMEG